MLKFYASRIRINCWFPWIFSTRNQNQINLILLKGPQKEALAHVKVPKSGPNAKLKLIRWYSIDGTAILFSVVNCLILRKNELLKLIFPPQPPPKNNKNTCSFNCLRINIFRFLLKIEKKLRNSFYKFLYQYLRSLT